MKQVPAVALLLVGIGVIVVGVVLMFKHQQYEADFQNHLLSEFHGDYRWRSIGDDHAGLGAVVVGALMMTVSAVVARRT
jgi:drug/metabolite transporter (DMT)-like permease